MRKKIKYVYIILISLLIYPQLQFCPQRASSRYYNHSLDYLFNNGYAAQGLFKDIDGYYVYDSKYNFAAFDYQTGKFTVYDQPNTGFFPFNEADQNLSNKATTKGALTNHHFGMNILVPDQRAHGQSEGKYITFGVKESEDMLDWLSYHNANFGDIPIFFHGMSMGASTVLYLADAELPSNVRGIIADCGFTSPKDIIKRVYKELIHLPAGPAIWAADLFARIFAGFSLAQKDTRKSLQNCKVPILMIHGMLDDFVPRTMTDQGYAACQGEKQLLLVAEATHGVSFLKDPVGYTSAIFYFLKRQIKQLEY
jgi:alpha/beta superfamily hydrolase